MSGARHEASGSVRDGRAALALVELDHQSVTFTIQPAEVVTDEGLLAITVRRLQLGRLVTLC